MDWVLLKDYRPTSTLVVTQTAVPKARFGAIDVHTHVYARTQAEVDRWVHTMDEVGVDVTVVLTGAVGADFDELARLYLDSHADRFQLYCGIDTANAGGDDYPERAAAELRRCFDVGARGVGEITDKGSGITHDARAHEQRLHVDDSRLDLVWATCGDLNVPVNLHIADHPSAWQPPDQTQERPPHYQRYNQHGADVPGYEELLAKRDRLLDRHPGTTFVAAHLSNQGNDLGRLATVLDQFPNLFIDICERDYEIGRQPRAAAAFLSKYRDRVLFATDRDPFESDRFAEPEQMYRAWWRLLETADEYFGGLQARRCWWMEYGLALPEDVLRDLYRDNARRLLNWTPTAERTHHDSGRR